MLNSDLGKQYIIAILTWHNAEIEICTYIALNKTSPDEFNIAAHTKNDKLTDLFVLATSQLVNKIFYSCTKICIKWWNRWKYPVECLCKARLWFVISRNFTVDIKKVRRYYYGKFFCIYYVKRISVAFVANISKLILSTVWSEYSRKFIYLQITNK